jgi:hypothetical protein
MESSFIGRLCLSVAMSLAVTALFGAATASAVNETVLCKINEVPCGGGNQYLSGQVFEGKASNTTFATEFGTLSCAASTVKLKITATAAEPLPGEVNALTFEGCKEPEFESTCSITALNLSYLAKITRGLAPDGWAEVWRELVNPGARVSCFSGFFKCSFKTELITPKIFGGNPAEVVVKDETLVLSATEGTAECPLFALWSGTYKATSPTSIFVSRN